MVRHIRRLQVITLLWMLVECALALLAAWRARSPVLLAFGADSLVELLSAVVVLMQFMPRLALKEHHASRLAGFLLYFLAGVLVCASTLALWTKARPDTSWLGIGVALAALVAMPLLSTAKRKAGKRTRNIALTADAAQSATCAFLAGITLAGLALNAALRIPWSDPVAALAAVPILCIEGKRALRGDACCQGPAVAASSLPLRAAKAPPSGRPA